MDLFVTFEPMNLVYRFFEWSEPKSQITIQNKSNLIILTCAILCYDSPSYAHANLNFFY